MVEGEEPDQMGRVGAWLTLGDAKTDTQVHKVRPSGEEGLEELGRVWSGRARELLYATLSHTCGGVCRKRSVCGEHTGLQVCAFLGVFAHCVKKSAPTNLERHIL